jgi:hypothetical protein
MPGRGKIYFPSSKLQNGSGAYLAFYSIDKGGSLSLVKAAGA